LSPVNKTRSSTRAAGTLAGGLALYRHDGGIGHRQRIHAFRVRLSVTFDLDRRGPPADGEVVREDTPNVKVNITTFDGGANGDGSVEAKVALFNRIRHGWAIMFYSDRQYPLPVGLE
jgi:hypothetical protein